MNVLNSRYILHKIAVLFLAYASLYSQTFSADKKSNLCDEMTGVDKSNCGAALDLLMSGGPKEFKPTVMARETSGNWAFRYEISQNFQSAPLCTVLMNHLVLLQDQKTRLLYTSSDDMLDFNIAELGIHETAIPGRMGEIFVDGTQKLNRPLLESPQDTKDNAGPGIRVEILQREAYIDWERKAVKRDCNKID